MVTRTFAALLAAVLLAGCGADSRAAAPGASASTSVRVTLDGDGDGGGGARTVGLSCPSARRASACRRLRALPRSAFRPVEPGAICTQIYAGPQTGAIRGTVRGRRVNARYKRTDGCEEARWRRVAAILRIAR